MPDTSHASDPQAFVRWMREASPYMRAHRGHTFVIHVGGELVADPGFAQLIQDLTLLTGIGVKLVIVHGCRPQASARIAAAGIDSRYVGHLRVTDAVALTHVKDAAAAVRFTLEAQFAHATRIRPAGAAALRITGGNFIMARPAGVMEGIDLEFTGEIRRIDAPAISAQLTLVDIVLLSPLAYSPTGETFSLSAVDLATAVAIELSASKLIFLELDAQVVDAAGSLVRQLTPREARAEHYTGAGCRLLVPAVRACQFGVERVHLINSAEGGLLLELFTRDGIGTLLSNTPFDQLRRATIEDVGGILDLLEPLETEGVLVKRSREKLETEIDHFMVMVRDGATVACGALYPFATEQAAEIAGIAVEPHYRRHGFGRALLAALEAQAQVLRLTRVFVLTTQATHWFEEQGYQRTSFDELPTARQKLYNFQRNSQVLFKVLQN